MRSDITAEMYSSRWSIFRSELTRAAMSVGTESGSGGSLLDQVVEDCTAVPNQIRNS